MSEAKLQQFISLEPLLARQHLDHAESFRLPSGFIIFIDDGAILGGSLPVAKMKLVQAWIEIHREDLQADWKLAVSGEPVFKIEPLR